MSSLMIEINLLPEELKVKRAKDTEYNFILNFLPPILLAFLVVINIYVISLTTIKNIQFKILNKKWEALAPERQKIEELSKESQALSQDAKAIQQLISKRVPWSAKLNKLSLLLPSGIWFNEMSLNTKDFVLKGSVISLKKEEMSLINLFLNNLKEDKLFFSDFNSLDLKSVQRQLLGGYEVVNFILSGNLKTK